MQRPGALSLTLAAFWLVLASPALAQRFRGQGPPRSADPSHVLLPGGIGDRGAFEEELVNRLNRARDLAASERLLKKLIENPKDLGLDPKALEGFARNLAGDIAKDPKRFGIDLKDKKWQDLAKQLADKKTLTAEQLKALEKIATNPNSPPMKALLKQLEQKKEGLSKTDKEGLEATRRIVGNFDPPQQRAGPGVQPPSSVVPMGQPVNPMNPPAVQPSGGQPPAPPPLPANVKPPPPAPPAAPSGARADNRSWFSRQLGKLRSTTGLGSGFRGLFRGMFSERTGLGRFSRSLSSRASGLRSKLLPSFGGLRMKGFMGGLGKVVPRNLKLSPSVPKGLSPRGLDGVSASGLGGGVLAVLLLFGAGVVVWLILAGRRWVRGEAGRTWRLGPWPVTPTAVQTRGDVVKAFEYLAMLLMGRRAVPANHREIAGQLAVNDLTGQRRLAAAELADLYEHARYAPPDEHLSPDEVASARRDLSLLSGRSAA